MLDIKLIREEPDKVKKALSDRNLTFKLDALLMQDQKLRKLTQQGDELRHQKRKASDDVGRLKREGSDVKRQLAALKKVSEQEAALEKEASKLEQEIRKQLFEIPNIPHDSVPVGPNAKSNQVVRTWGEPKSLILPPRPTWSWPST